MSGGQGDVDRNEPATAYKLAKARERGSIVRSADVTFATVLVAALGCMYGLGIATIDRMALLIPQSFSMLSRKSLDVHVALAHAVDVGVNVLALLAGPVAVIWVAASLATAMQARGVFSSVPLKPDFSRINPAVGLKRVFSVRALHELFRTSLKLGLLAVAAVVWSDSKMLVCIACFTWPRPACWL